jgi:WD40 repeat protein
VIQLALKTVKLFLRTPLVEAVRVIREESPQKPSTIDRTLRGDLETIVLKAQEKERERRYQTAVELSGDIRRYLKDEPILAHPPSALYQLGKFVSRHKTVVGGVCGVFTILIAGIIATSWQAHMATEARRHAETETRRARAAEKEAESQKQLARNEAVRAEKQAALAQKETERADERAHAADYERYVAAIQFADASIKNGRLALAERTLLSAPEQMRNWEWGHLIHRLHPERLQLPVENASIVSYSPDGTRIYVGCDDGSASIWDADTGRQRVILFEEGSGNFRAAWSPDGTRVLSDHMSGIKISDAANGRQLIAVDDWRRNQNRYTRWSPDGTRILVAPFGLGETHNIDTAAVLDADTGREILSLQVKSHSSSTMVAEWSRDGDFIFTASDVEAKVWDATKGSEVSTLHDEHIPTIREYGREAVWSPDDTRILTSGPTGSVWDVATGQKMLDLGRCSYATWDPQGRRIMGIDTDCSGTEKRCIQIWDADSGEETQSLYEPRFASWNPDGEHLLAISSGGIGNLWHLDTQEKLPTHMNFGKLDLLPPRGGNTHETARTAWSIDGDRVLGISWNDAATVWDVFSGNSPNYFRGPRFVQDVLWSLGGVHILRGPISPREPTVLPGRSHPGLYRIPTNNAVAVWDSISSQIILRTAGVRGVYSPDGNRLFIASNDGTGKVLDVSTQAVIRSLGSHQNPIYNGIWSRDSKRILTNDRDFIAKLWDVETGRELITLDGIYLWTADYGVWSSDGTLLFTPGLESRGIPILSHRHGSQRIQRREVTSRVLDINTGLECVVFKNPRVRAVWIPGEKQLLSFEPFSSSPIGVWDAAAGKEILTLGAHSGADDIFFCPDGSRFLSVNSDGIKVWDAEEWSEVWTADRGGRNAAWSPDQTRIVTAADQLYIWDAVTGRELMSLSHQEELELVTGLNLRVRWSPDGTRILTESIDGTVSLLHSVPWRKRDFPGDTAMNWRERFTLWQADRYGEWRSQNLGSADRLLKQTSAKVEGADSREHVPCDNLQQSPAAFAESSIEVKVEELLDLEWSEYPIARVLEFYGKRTGRTLLIGPGVPRGPISLEHEEPLSETEGHIGIETLLRSHRVQLIPLGEKFLKVVVIRKGQNASPPAAPEPMSDPVLRPLGHVDIPYGRKFAEVEGRREYMRQVRFVEVPIAVLLDLIGEISGRIVIIAPSVPAIVLDLRSNTLLTESELLFAIEHLLRLYRVAVIPVGNRFVKVMLHSDEPTSSEWPTAEPVPVPVVTPRSALEGQDGRMISVRYIDTPLSTVLDQYGKLTGRTPIIAPDVREPLITMKSNNKLTETEFLIAVEIVLELHGIKVISQSDTVLKAETTEPLRAGSR